MDDEVVPLDCPLKCTVIERLLGMGQNFEWNAVIRKVNEFCARCPNEKDRDTIVLACAEELKGSGNVVNLYGDSQEYIEEVVVVSNKANSVPAHKPSPEVVVLDESRALRPMPSSSSSSNQYPNKKPISLWEDEGVEIVGQGAGAILATAGTNRNKPAGQQGEDVDEVQMITPVDPLHEVLRVFPNAKHTHVQALLARLAYNVQDAIWEMAEKGYEKDAEADKPPPTDEALDFTSTSWETSAAYRSQACQELYRNFPYLKFRCIDAVLAHHKHHYFPALAHLEERCGMPAVFPQGGIHPYDKTQFSKPRLLEIAARIAEKTAQHKNAQELVPLHVLGVVRGHVASFASDPVLLRELGFVRQRKDEERQEKLKQLREEEIEREAEAEGSAVECMCCYGEHAFELMVQCSEGHLFCRGCLRHYLENSVFGTGRAQLKCLAPMDPACTGGIPESCIQRSLPSKVWQRYSEIQAKEALQQASLTDTGTCMKCNQTFILPPGTHILACPSCHVQTCTLCNEAAHPPLKCSEVEKPAQTNSRVKLEEALTQARVRECGKCKTRFFKIEGCNKMTCACGALMCYVCRKDISKESYKHFCQTPLCTHGKCGKCALFTNSSEDDRLAMLEAGVKVLQEGGGLDVGADNANPHATPAAANQPASSSASSSNGTNANANVNVRAARTFGGAPLPPHLAHLSEAQLETLSKLLEGGLPNAAAAKPQSVAERVALGARVVHPPQMFPAFPVGVPLPQAPVPGHVLGAQALAQAVAQAATIRRRRRKRGRNG